jgi:hypothetical protein
MPGPVGGGARVIYTWAADATGDGQVTADDYFRIDLGFLGRKTLFHEGDFSFDGVIDLGDYATIDEVFLAQA